MSIDRYAKFISEQTRIVKLDEAKKDKIRPGQLGISFLHPGHYNLVDHEDRVFGSVTKGIRDGKHGIHVRYYPDSNNPQEAHHATISFHTPEGTGFDYSPHGGHNEILNRAIETANVLHSTLSKPSS